MASVCEVQSSGTPGLTFADTMALRFTEENNIMVTYVGQRRQTTGMLGVLFVLFCTSGCLSCAGTYVTVMIIRYCPRGNPAVVDMH